MSTIRVSLLMGEAEYRRASAVADLYDLSVEDWIVNVVADAAADKARLDWLETKVVNVREPLLYGSRDLFWSSPEGDEETPPEQVGPSDIRAQIDQRSLNVPSKGGK